MSQTSRASLRRPLIVLVGAVLLWLVVGPNLRLLWDSFQGPDGLTLRAYRDFFAGKPEFAGQPNIELLALWNAVVVALGSIVLSALVGVPLALLFNSYDFPGRRTFAALATVPVLLPPLVGVVAFLFLYDGSIGVIPRALQALFHLDAPPWEFKGIGAVLVVHAYSMYVYFYTFVTAGLARLDQSQLAAASTLGAGRVRRFWTVLLPLLTPSLVGAALLVFMMSMASFTAPLIFEVRVLTVQLLRTRRDGDLALMSTETAVLAAVCIAFLLLLRWIEGRGRYIGGTKGASSRRTPVSSGWLRGVLAVVGIATVIVLLLPHGMLLLMSFADDPKWTTQILPPAYTLDAWRYVATDPEGRRPVLNSFAMAFQAAGMNLLFALAAAYLVGRFRFRGRALLEAAAILPYAIPGTVIALSLAAWFSVRQPWCGRFVLIGTYTILPLAYFVRNLPVTVRAVQASLAQVDPAVEEAAATLGSPPLRVLFNVVLPLVMPGAAMGAMLALIAGMGEFVASWVLYTEQNRPLAIEMWSQVRDGRFGQAAAYGVVMIAVTVVVLLVFGRLGRKGELVV